MRLFAIIFILLAHLFSVAQAFDQPNWCNKAKSLPEKLVCGHDELSANDILLNKKWEAYKATHTEAEIATHTAILKKWNSDVFQKCEDVDCLRKAQQEILSADFLQGTKEQPENKAETKQEPEAKQEAETKTKSFAISHDQFLERIQSSENAALIDFDINEKSKTKQDNGSITRVVMLNQFGFITTDSSPENKLTSVLYISSGDGTQESGAKIIYLMASVLEAIGEKFSSKQAIEFIFNTLEPTKLAMDGDKVEVNKDGVNYSLSRSSAVGLMLTMTPE